MILLKIILAWLVVDVLMLVVWHRLMSRVNTKSAQLKDMTSKPVFTSHLRTSS